MAQGQDRDGRVQVLPARQDLLRQRAGAATRHRRKQGAVALALAGDPLDEAVFGDLDAFEKLAILQRAGGAQPVKPHPHLGVIDLEVMFEGGAEQRPQIGQRPAQRGAAMFVAGAAPEHVLQPSAGAGALGGGGEHRQQRPDLGRAHPDLIAVFPAQGKGAEEPQTEHRRGLRAAGWAQSFGGLAHGIPLTQGNAINPAGQS